MASMVKEDDIYPTEADRNFSALEKFSAGWKDSVCAAELSVIVALRAWEPFTQNIEEGEQQKKVT